MKKLFQKRSVAVLVMVLCMIAGVLLGQSRKPKDLGEAATILSGTYQYVLDEEGVIREKTAEYIDAMNDSLFAQTGAQIAVQVVETTGDMEIDVYTEKEFERLGVGSAERDNGILLVLALENYYEGQPIGDYYMGWGSGFDYFLTDTLADILYTYMEEDFAAGDYDAAVKKTFDAMVDCLADHYDVTVKEHYIPVVKESYTAQRGDYASRSYGTAPVGAGEMLGTLLVLMVILLAVWVIADGFRYRSYRRRYIRPGMGVPPVVYYPVFWGRHYRPYGGYRRPPRAPRPPRSPMGGGMHRPPRPPMGGGNRRPTASRPPFSSGGSFGGGVGRGSRGGFGGGSFGGGVGRGGGFGGGRGRR